MENQKIIEREDKVILIEENFLKVPEKNKVSSLSGILTVEEIKEAEAENVGTVFYSKEIPNVPFLLKYFKLHEKHNIQSTDLSESN